MVIDIITIFPNIFRNVFDEGILYQAIKSGLLNINIINLRDFASGKHKQVDDRPFGGNVGMVLMPEPLFKAIEYSKSEHGKDLNSIVVFLTPQGKRLTQEVVESLACDHAKKHYVIICGRYEGIDQRVREKLVNMEISIGDFVMSGGEFGAMVFVDVVGRLIPGAIKNEHFNDSESFSNQHNRQMLDYPQYTRPRSYKGMKVPDVLLSGNHARIKKWRDMHRKNVVQ